MSAAHISRSGLIWALVFVAVIGFSCIGFVVGRIVQSLEWARAIVLAKYERDHPLPEWMCDYLVTEESRYLYRVAEVKDAMKEETRDLQRRREKTQRFLWQ
jgi:hypothetical protein